MRRALALAPAGLPYFTETPRTMLGMVLTWAGRLQEARPLLEADLGLATARGDAWAECAVIWHLAELECWARDLPGRRSWPGDAWSSRGTCRSRTWSRASATQRARGRLPGPGRGGPEGALVGGAAARAMGDALAEMRNELVLGFLALSLGDPGRACEHLRPLVERLRAAGIVEPGIVPALPLAAEAMVEVGDLEGATALADELEELGGRLDRPWARVTAARFTRSPRPPAATWPGRSTASRERTPTIAASGIRSSGRAGGSCRARCCAAPRSGPRRGGRSRRRSPASRRSARRSGPSGRGPSSSGWASAAERGRADRDRSRRSPSWRPRARPTGRSPASCSSRSRPWRRTSRAATGSSGCAPASSWPGASSEMRAPPGPPAPKGLTPSGRARARPGSARSSPGPRRRPGGGRSRGPPPPPGPGGGGGGRPPKGRGGGGPPGGGRRGAPRALRVQPGLLAASTAASSGPPASRTPPPAGRRGKPSATRRPAGGSPRRTSPFGVSTSRIRAVDGTNHAVDALRSPDRRRERLAAGAVEAILPPVLGTILTAMVTPFAGDLRIDEPRRRAPGAPPGGARLRRPGGSPARRARPRP